MMEHPVPLPRARSRTRLPVPIQRRSGDSDTTSPAPTILHVAEVHKATARSENGSSGERENKDDSSGKMCGSAGDKRKRKVKRKGTFLVRHKSPQESTADELNNPTDIELQSKGKSSGRLSSSKTSSIESLRLPMETGESSATPKPSSQMLGFVSERVTGSNSSLDSVQEVIEGFKMPAPPRRGSATETLSESSTDGERSKIKLQPLSHGARLKKPSGYTTETLSEDSSHHNSPSRASSAPLPRPRQRTLVDQSIVAISSVVSSKLEEPRSSSSLELPKQPVTSPVRAEARGSSRSLLNRSDQELPTVTDVIVSESRPSSKTKGLSSPISRLDSERRPDSPRSYYTSSSVDYKDTGVMQPPRTRRSKKKRKIKDNSGESTANSEKDSPAKNNSKEDEAAEILDKDTVVCITVHRCEPLRMTDLHRRPIVRIHTMDSKVGGYKTSAFGKHAVDIVETQPFDHIHSRSIIPSWEEDLILIEPASHVIAPESIFIMELLEPDTEDVIAWAFLKPLAANGKKNVGLVLRLQLYKPLKSRQSKNGADSLPLAFTWYSKNKLSVYRSTLLVSVNVVDSRLVVKPTISGITGAEPSKTKSRRSSQLSSTGGDMRLSEAEKELIGVVWSRLPSLSCKLPNKINSTLPAGPDGGMSVSYSRSGLLVACHTSNTVTVFTYRGSRYLTLVGHHGLVYDLSWSPDDSFLLSSSADTTACVWNIKLRQSTPVAILNHSSYVYCGTWLGPSLVVTGCYDRGLRLWDLSSVPTLIPKNSAVLPNQSLIVSTTIEPVFCTTVHKARVNSMAVVTAEPLFVTGDSEGVLVFWKLSTTLPRQLEMLRTVVLRELRGQVINKLAAHPGGKRFLVATRDSTLRMVDLNAASVIQWFHGSVNSKLQSSSGFCACGSRVVCCSETGDVFVWDANTGERLALLKGLYEPDSPAALAFHPKDNLMALVSHKTGAFPHLVLYSFARDTFESEIDVEWFDNRLDNINSASSVSDLSLRCSRESFVEPNVSRKKKRGILRALLQGGTKQKTKKGILNAGYSDTESGGGVKDSHKGDRKKRTGYRPLLTRNDEAQVSHRLTDIIKRMDDLIVTATPSSPSIY